MYLDTRDLVEKREELKHQVLDSFLETFEHYADQVEEYDDILFDEEEVQEWKDNWLDEIAEINDIERLEDEVNDYSGDDFEFGVTLIEEKDFEEYCEDFMYDCGYISRDLPAIIGNNIDWSGIADDMRIDYTEVEYEGTTYLFR